MVVFFKGKLGSPEGDAFSQCCHEKCLERIVAFGKVNKKDRNIQHDSD